MSILRLHARLLTMVIQAANMNRKFLPRGASLWFNIGSGASVSGEATCQAACTSEQATGLRGVGIHER